MAATQKENFETHVSLSGIEQYRRGQKMLGAGWKAVRGDLDGAASGFKKLNLTTGQWLAVSAAAGGAGYKLMMGLGAATNAAMQAESVQVKLRSALASNLGMSKEAADAMADYGSSLSAAAGASPFGDEEINNAMAMLSTFRLTADQIKAFVPSLMDMTQGYSKATGETADLQQTAIMLGKAVNGNIGALRRYGIFVDEAAFKEKGWVAVLEEVRREFGGQSTAAMTTAAGAVKGYNDSIGELQESIGTGLLPVVRSLANGGRAIANALTTMNDATHGAVGIVGALGATVAVGGALALVAMRSWRMLRDEMTGVAGAADRAAASLKTAGAAATTSGAAAATGAATGAAGNAASAGASATAGAAGNAATMGAGAAAGKAAGKAAMKGIGVGIAAGLAGAALNSVGRISQEDVEKGPGRVAGRAMAGMAGSTLTYGSYGAMLGSFVPGLGTAAGAAVGGAIGLGVGAYGAFSQRGDAEKAAAEAAKAEKAAAEAAKAAQVSTVPKGGASKSESYLKAIVEELKDTKRAIIGGSDRTANAVNQGDLQRAVYGTLARAVV